MVPYFDLLCYLPIGMTKLLLDNSQFNFPIKLALWDCDKSPSLHLSWFDGPKSLPRWDVIVERIPYVFVILLQNPSTIFTRLSFNLDVSRFINLFKYEIWVQGHHSLFLWLKSIVCLSDHIIDIFVLFDLNRIHKWTVYLFGLRELIIN